MLWGRNHHSLGKRGAEASDDNGVVSNDEHSFSQPPSMSRFFLLYIVTVTEDVSLRSDHAPRLKKSSAASHLLQRKILIVLFTTGFHVASRFVHLKRTCEDKISGRDCPHGGKVSQFSCQ